MRLATRHLLDKSFSGAGFLAIGLMAAALLALLAPMFRRGAGAFLFRGTIEHRRLLLEKFERGNRDRIEADIAAARMAREPIYRHFAAFEEQVENGAPPHRAALRREARELKKRIRALLGPFPGEPRPILMRDQYGQTRWDRALVKREAVLFREEWDYSDPTRPGVRVLVPRAERFRNTPLEALFPLIEHRLEAMLLPRRTLYARFLTDDSFDSHLFGGIGAEVLGTLYLTLWALLLAIPMGILAAVYLSEYARESRLLNLLRTCISTLAGVPSIVFGLFGLAFFINTLKVSDSKSVLAGSMTLALMVLPTVIRTAEEALRAVPHTYREAALSLGAGRGHAVRTILLPAALPGILTGIVISMGRAAGETAPIIFTAAVSVGRRLTPLQALTQPTPALSWNLYNLATEHEAVDEIRHVQYGLVLTLVSLVLLLNLAAILLRARVARRLRT